MSTLHLMHFTLMLQHIVEEFFLRNIRTLIIQPQKLFPVDRQMFIFKLNYQFYCIENQKYVYYLSYCYRHELFGQKLKKKIYI